MWLWRYLPGCSHTCVSIQHQKIMTCVHLRTETTPVLTAIVTMRCSHRSARITDDGLLLPVPELASSPRYVGHPGSVYFIDCLLWKNPCVHRHMRCSHPLNIEKKNLNNFGFFLNDASVHLEYELKPKSFFYKARAQARTHAHRTQDGH